MPSLSLSIRPFFFSNARRFLASLLCVFSIGGTGHVYAGESPVSSVHPFRVGERLTYDITFLSISAGTAVMEVSPGDNASGRPSGKFVTTAVSSPKVTRFFPVDNRVESLTNLISLLPDHMTFRRREGKKKEDIEYTFNRTDNTVAALRGGVTEVVPIPADTHDLISCLYYVRSLLTLKPGASQTLTVYHDKKIRQVEVRVEKIEMLEGAWGRLETAQVLVIMPFQGIFLNQGNIRVWFTTDQRRIPVRMKAKVVVGSIVADLVDGIPEVSPHK